MKIEITALIGSIITAWVFIRKLVFDLGKIAEPVIIEAEKLAQDGIIDRADRKKLVMVAVEGLKASGRLKLGFVGNFVLSIVIDRIAKKLPDFKITQEVKSLVAIANLKNNVQTK